MNGTVKTLETMIHTQEGSCECICAECRALRLAITALQSQQGASADRGEAVCWITPQQLDDLRTDKPWVAGAFGQFSQRQREDYTVALCVSTPPSQIGYDDGSGRIRDWSGAAPSGVSDAMVERAKQGADEYRAWLFENMQDGSDEELFRRALIAALGQPQPGRVEGDAYMDAWQLCYAAETKAQALAEELRRANAAYVHELNRAESAVTRANCAERLLGEARRSLAFGSMRSGLRDDIDAARWRKLCALVDTHNPAYWYVHPGMGCDRIKGEAQLVAAIDAAPTASSQEPDHGDDEEPCSFCLQRGCNGECGGDQ